MKKSQDSSVFLGGPIKKSPVTLAQQSATQPNNTNNSETSDFFLLTAPNNTGRTVGDTAAQPNKPIEIPPLNFGSQNKPTEKFNVEINNRLVSAKKSKPPLSKVRKKESRRAHKRQQQTAPNTNSDRNEASQNGGQAANLNDMTADEDNLSIKSDDASLSDEPAKNSIAPGTATKLKRQSSNATKEKKFNPIRAVDYETTITNIYLNGHQKGSSSSNGGKTLLNAAARPKTNPPSRNSQINGFNFVTGKFMLFNFKGFEFILGKHVRLNNSRVVNRLKINFSKFKRLKFKVIM